MIKVGWDSSAGRDLLRLVEQKCRAWAPAVDRYCGLPSGTTDPAVLLTAAWEVLDRFGRRVIAANSPWAYLRQAVRNAVAVDAAATALQTATLPAQSMRMCRSLLAPVRLGLDYDDVPKSLPTRDLAYGSGTTDRWSPALHALLDLVVVRGGDRAYWADALDRAVEVIADARRSYEEHALYRDPYLRQVLGLRREQLGALGALLVGTRRGNRAKQSLLLALRRNCHALPEHVPGAADRMRVLLDDEQPACSSQTGAMTAIARSGRAGLPGRVRTIRSGPLQAVLA